MIGYKVVRRAQDGTLRSVGAGAGGIGEGFRYVPGLITDEPPGPAWGALAVFETETLARAWLHAVAFADAGQWLPFPADLEIWEVDWRPSARLYLQSPHGRLPAALLPVGTCFARAVRLVRRVQQGEVAAS
jgi:hypothetical protein